MKELKYLNKYLLRNKWRLILGIVFIVIANVFALLPAQLIGKSFDVVTELIKKPLPFSDLDISNLKTKLYYFGLIVIGASLAKGFFTFLMRQTIIIVSRFIEYDLKNEIYSKYQVLSSDFYKKNRTGDLMSRITEDVSHVRMYLGPALMYSFNLISLIIIVVFNMFRIDWELTLIVLTPLPLLAYSVYKVSYLINKKSETVQVYLAKVSTFVQESFSGIRILKSYGIENNSNIEFNDLSEAYRIKSLSLTKVNAAFFPTLILLISISSTLTIYYGGVKVINNEITPGVIAEFLIYINMLTWPVATIGWVTSVVQRAEASQKRLNEFLNSDNIIKNHVNYNTEIKGNIEFNNVSYTYPESGIKALKNINFSVEKGQTLAIMGLTGSGKSTIANLISRLIEANSGEILFDHLHINSINIADLRKSIGYITQESFLFSDTVSNNIAFAATNASQEEIIKIAKIVDIHSEIINFPNGYDTKIGERGVTLSGGQKQRISIARALLARPKILIFDDCFSAIDSSTESKILHNLKLLPYKTTIVFITHRISTAKNSDKIIILNKGEISEQGTHSQLITINGFYTKLLHSQQ
ncbi:MAG: ABC transporter ATP-binding protein [Bacteroidota bacterium]